MSKANRTMKKAGKAPTWMPPQARAPRQGRFDKLRATSQGAKR